MMEWIPIRVLLYKAKIDGKAIDNVIAEWTWLWNMMRRGKLTPEMKAMLRKWSHAELWTPDDEGRWTNAEGRFSGRCWTSTMGAIRDKNSHESNGTVCRLASGVLRNPDRWSVSDEIWLPRMVYELLVGYLKYKVFMNAGYDKKAIASYGTPWRFHNAEQEICSEHTDDDLKFAARLFFAWVFSELVADIGKCPGVDPYYNLLTFMKHAVSDVPSPLRLGMNLILSGVKVRDLA